MSYFDDYSIDELFFLSKILNAERIKLTENLNTLDDITGDIDTCIENRKV